MVSGGSSRLFVYAWKGSSLVRLNLGALIGFVGAAALFIGAVILTSRAPLLYLNGAGAALVIGGTATATLISFSFAQLQSAFARMWRLLKAEHLLGKNDIERFVQIAGYRAAGKVSSLDEEIKHAGSPFVRTGLQLLADGVPAADIANVLEMRMRHQEALEQNDATVFKTMAIFTPAFGLAATLIGLVNMLFLMGEGATPQQVGMNMSLALVATLYGVILANAVLRPIAIKIELKTRDRMRVMATIVEAITSIAEGRGPTHIREILYALASSYRNDVGQRDTLGAISEKELYGN